MNDFFAKYVFPFNKLWVTVVIGFVAVLIFAANNGDALTAFSTWAVPNVNSSSEGKR